MPRWALSSLLLLFAVDNRPVWLVIAGSHASVRPAIETKQKLQASWPEASIVASDDCYGLRRGLYLAVAAKVRERGAAQVALSKVKTSIPDAYVHECRPKPASRILFGVPVVEPSVETVPAYVVNWTDDDRISKVNVLPGAGYLWIRRGYDPVREDPREGRRTAVLFFAESPEHPVQLESDCTDPQFAQKGARVALSCARETAVDTLLHETKVYDAKSGKELLAVRRCQQPELRSAIELSCRAEEIGADGQLRLRVKTVAIPAAKR
jgi:hypothetical protein